MNTQNGSHDEGPPRLLLIGGRPRSGTTLLRNLCNAHPDISLTHEFGTFLGLNEPHRVYQRRILRQWRAQPILGCRTFGALPSKPRLRRWATSTRAHLFTIRYLRRIRRYGPGPVDLSAVEATLRAFLPRTAIVGDKMPAYMDRLDILAPASGLARVMIYRDCRDVTSSHLKLARTTWRDMPWIRNQDTAEKVATRWVAALETMERHRDRIHVVRYEDLVREPRRELSTLAEWLGVDPAAFPERSFASIRDTGIGKHRNGLTPEELEAVMRIAGPTMARLGYA